PIPLHINPPIAVPPPVFTSVPPPCTAAPHHDGHSVHAAQPGRVQQSAPTSQSQQQHPHASSHQTSGRDRMHEKSPRASTSTPPTSREHQRHGNTPGQNSQQQNSSSQVKTELNGSPIVKKEPKDKDEHAERVTPNRTRPSGDTPTRAGPVKRERTSSEKAEEISPSPLTEEEEKPPAKKSKEEDAATSWRTFYNAELARQKEAELNLDIDPEMRDLVAQSLTLENKLVAE
ncbi:hypothetical protein OESDEN_22826, partial [Oesophagostomum dentatum]